MITEDPTYENLKTFISTARNSRKKKRRLDRTADIYTIGAFLVVVTAIIASTLANASGLAINDLLIGHALNAVVGDISQSFPFFPFMLLAQTILSVVWGWLLYSLGPISTTRENMVWIFQSPIERSTIFRRKVYFVLGGSAVLGAVLSQLLLSVYMNSKANTLTILCIHFYGCITFLSAGLFVLTLQNPTLVTFNGIRASLYRWPELDMAASAQITLTVSVLSLDFSAATRSLFFSRRPRSEFESRRFNRFGNRWRAAIVAEWRTLLRTRSAGLMILILALMTVASYLSPLVKSPFLLYLVSFALIFATSEVVGIGVKMSEGNPYRYAMLGIGETSERFIQFVLPLAAGVLWSVLVFAVINLVTINLMGFLSSIFLGLGIGAVSVYNSDRKPTGWGNESFMATPLGPVPIKSLINSIKGIFLLLLVFLPNFMTIMQSPLFSGGVYYGLAATISAFLIAFFRRR